VPPRHCPEALQAFTIAVSTQSVLLGGQIVQLSPQCFPAHGTYVLVLDVPPVLVTPPVLDEPPELDVHPKLSKVPAAQAQQLELSTGPPQ